MTHRTWSTVPSNEWHDTLETLHLWTQVIGKIRLVRSPWLNHSWNVPLYVTPTGLTTGLVPYDDEGFEWTFDLSSDEATLITSTGRRSQVPLVDGLSVARFYSQVMDAMTGAAMPVQIHTTPSEIADAIPFPDDDVHATYDAAHARALHRVLLDTTRVFETFRAGFRGKASRVHFFWGSFDLAVTRFSGREAPRHPGGLPNFPDDVAAEAYSHELTSVGFWPGTRSAPDPIFYAYAYPAPDGYSTTPIEPAEAFWLDELGEFALPYAAVAASDDGDATLLRFCETTHAAAADLAGWDRARLECDEPHGPNWFASRPHASESRPSDRTEDGAVEVYDEPDEHRYVVTLDGQVRGSAVYHRRDDTWIFVHTETDPAFGGRGLGSALARDALDDVERQGGKVVPLCPFIAAWLDNHPDRQHLIDHDKLDSLTRR